MFQAVVRHEELVDEVVHGRHSARLRIRRLELPAENGGPPLAIEQLTLPEGPTRPPVVLVHGLAQNRHTWRISRRSLAGALAERGYDVLNLELRGHGLSRRYGAGNATCFQDYTDDLSRVLQRCPEPAFVVGHSLGAAVCLDAATRVPVRGVVHVAGVYRFAGANRVLRALARTSLALEQFLLLPGLRIRTRWAGDLIGRLYAFTDVAGYGAPIAGWAPGSIERELLEERLRLGFDWTSVEVWLQMCRWATGTPFEPGERFCALDVPLLVIVGDRDPLVRPADARALYEASRSRDRTFLLMEAFEHGVHWGHIDLILGRRAPDELWPRLLDWLDAR